MYVFVLTQRINIWRGDLSKGVDARLPYWWSCWARRDTSVGNMPCRGGRRSRRQRREANLRVHVLDVGPGNGDSILIVSPTGKTVLIDAGDTGKGKAILEALKRYNIQQLDYFIATHPHPDHLGGADEVFKAIKVLHVIDNGQGPDVPDSLAPPKPVEPTPGKKAIAKPQSKKRLDQAGVITKFYDEYKEAITHGGRPV